VKADRAVRPSPPPLAPADSRRRVVLIEDDADIAEAIGYQLEKVGLLVKVARTGEEGLEAVRRGADLVLLDLNLPAMDGLEVCRLLRRQPTSAHLPIIIVSARADEVDRVLGLEMGADDYVVKPFSAVTLDARIRAVLRRALAPDADSVLAVGGLEVDPRACTVTLDGEPVELSPREFELLAYLAARPGQVVTKRELLTEVWRLPYGGADKTVDVHLSWLRRKLGESAQSPRFLYSVRGVGVKLMGPDE
jgi:two-component system, OmpR family, KDP operon response regulator KdpE